MIAFPSSGALADLLVRREDMPGRATDAIAVAWGPGTCLRTAREFVRDIRDLERLSAGRTGLVLVLNTPRHAANGSAEWLSGRRSTGRLPDARQEPTRVVTDIRGALVTVSPGACCNRFAAMLPTATSSRTRCREAARWPGQRLTAA